MDSIAPAGLPPAAIRLYAEQSARGSEIGEAARQGVEPVDTVSLSRPVDPPATFDEIIMNLRARGGREAPLPSLASLLEEIKRHLEEALSRAREERSDFFDRLDEFKERLKGVDGGNQIETAGQLVASVSPERMDAFVTGVERFLDAAGESGKGEDGQLPNGRLAIADLNLGLRFQDESGVGMEMESLTLAFHSRQDGGAPSSSLELVVNKDGVELQRD